MKNLKAQLQEFLCKAAVFSIRVYQMTFSPEQGLIKIVPSCCRFYPSCSEYTMLSIRQYGLLYGGVLSLKRILKCNPWNGGGYDPIH